MQSFYKSWMPPYFRADQSASAPRSNERSKGAHSRISQLQPLRFLFWSAFVLPFVVAATFSWILHERISAEAVVRAQQNAAIVREHLLHAFDAQENTMTMIESKLHGKSWDEIEHSTSIQEFLRDISVSALHMEGIWLVGPDGRVAAGTSQRPTRSSFVTDQDYFKVLKERDTTYLGPDENLDSQSIGGLGFDISRRRTNFAGEFEGLIRIRISLGYLEEFWSTLIAKTPSAIAIVRDDGAVLARYPTGAGNPRRDLVSSPFYQLKGEQNEGLFQWRSTIEGHDRFVAISKLANLPAFAIVGIDRSPQLASWRMQTSVFLVMAGVASLSLASLVRLAQVRESSLFAEVERRTRAETSLIAKEEHVAALKRAEAKLLLSEQRFRVAVKNMSGFVYDWRVGSSEAYRSDGLQNLLGYSFEDGVIKPGWWFDQIHPEDQLPLADLRENLRAGRITDFAVEYRIRQRDGHWVYVSDRASAIDNQDERLLIGTVIDISDRKRAEEHQQMLINELNHRVKNVLATVQSITRQTARNSETAADMAERLQDRFLALSKAHDQLIRTNWTSVDLRELVIEELAPYAEAQGRVSIEGPSVDLNATAGVTAALLIHELATNAAKYGALSVASGHLSVHWSLRDGEPRRICLIWEEHGLSGIRVPSHRGFGTRLIERGLGGFSGGSTSLEFRSDGVYCLLNLPLLPNTSLTPT
jgi:PAS domain S-box-containing protein